MMAPVDISYPRLIIDLVMTSQNLTLEIHVTYLSKRSMTLKILLVLSCQFAESLSLNYWIACTCRYSPYVATYCSFIVYTQSK